MAVNLFEGLNESNPTVEPKEPFQFKGPLGSVAAIGGGAAQAYGDFVSSAGNLGLEKLGIESRIPHPNLRKRFPEGLGTSGLFLAGEVGAPFLGPSGKALNAVMSFRRPKAYAGLLSDALRGAGIGYIGGEEAHGGRLGGALIAGPLGVAFENTGRKIAKRIFEDKQKIQKKGNELYESIFNKISEGKKPQVSSDFYEKIIPDASEVLQHTGPKQTKKLEEFLMSPTAKNAHWAQSELGSFVRGLEKKRARSGGVLLPSENEVYKKALSLQESVKDVLNKKLSPEGAEKYKNATEYYAKEVVPYLDKNLTKYEKGELSREKLLNNLYEQAASSKEGRQTLQEIGVEKIVPEKVGEKYPELKVHNFKKALKEKIPLVKRKAK